MPRIRVDNVGAFGLVKDAFSHEIPPEAWTTLLNTRPTTLGAEKFFGHAKTLGTDSAGIGEAPLWAFFVAVPAGRYWVLAGTTKVYSRLAVSPYTETEITRSAGVYAADATKKWNGGTYGSLFVLNNGVDLPQVWSPVAPATDLVNISTFGSGADAWPSTYRCAVMRPFGRYLVALDILKGATRYPQTVKWSHPADPGSMPDSWDPANEAKDAGEFPLADGNGFLVDCLPLRNQNMIYLENEVWSQTFRGGEFVFRFERALRSGGALAANCMALFKKQVEMHAVFGADDLYVHNGQVAESIIDARMRRWLFQQLEPNYYKRSFVVANPTYNEVLFCFPELGAEQPSLAIVWNYNENSIGVRELLQATSGSDTRTTAGTKGSPCITPGFIDDVAAEPWSGDPDSWDSDTTIWDTYRSNPATPRLFMVDRSAGKRLMLMDTTAQFDGTNYEWKVERVGLSIIGQDRLGKPKNDNELVKLCTEVWPRFEAPIGTEILVSVGAQMEQNDPITWSSEETFTVGTDEKVDFYISGRYLAVRMRATTSATLRLLGYDLVLAAVGKY